MTFWKPFFLSAALFSLTCVHASAFTITNEDEETYQVEFVEGEGDATGEIVELAPDYMIEDACVNGCNLKLNNGQTGLFSEGQNVVIRGGKFVVVD